MQGRDFFEKIILTHNNKVEGKKRGTDPSKYGNSSAVRIAKLGSTACNVSLSLLPEDWEEGSARKRREQTS